METQDRYRTARGLRSKIITQRNTKYRESENSLPGDSLCCCMSCSSLIQISIIILLIVFSIKLAFLTYLSWYKHSFSYNVQTKISTKLFRIFLKQPYIYFSQLNSSKLIQETKDEPGVYCSGMIVGKIDMISEMLIICGICILLLFYNFLPSMIIFLTVLGILVTYRVVFRKSALRWSKQKKYFESLSYNILKYV